ncbi:3-deoxy-D-manno-octulosonic acid transferase [Arenibacter latericius]|uniref:3-deoxy-D-manno-octulosonic acid transferase n=1 Tax=Arenibacter latericius TaxID=86104 RepID=UPI00055221D7|nr:glycosyltransferase N-terminal domain-containing protein [Arenibacter latericius]
MSRIYNFAIQISSLALRLVALFHPKIKLFVNGRKEVFPYLRKTLSKEDQVLWVHTASLGEFEQGLPVIERLKHTYPSYKIVVTFFSPSGYEVKKNSDAAHAITYLPLDTFKNAQQFVDLVNPKLVIFVKYEIWPNYLKILAERKIPTLLISALFKEEQIYFKGYGGFMRKALHHFSHIFVQNTNSVRLLNEIGITEVTLGGDTRFDRVMEIVERDNHLPFMEEFKIESPVMVAGSTWPEDEAVLVPYINADNSNLKYVLAPHNIKPEQISKLKASINKKTILYSELDNEPLSDYKVLIIDTIGILTKVYSYANIAYVGGGFATGLHNTLEPAVFGIPVIIGSNFKGFKEAEDLVEEGGVIVVNNKEEYHNLMNRLVSDKEFLSRTGEINLNYVNKNKGASVQIMDYISTLL